MKYYLTFTEEAVMNPKYYGNIGGRVEVSDNDHEYPVMEYAFLTKKVKGFRKFQDKWDDKYVTEKEFTKFKNDISRFV